MINVVKGLKIVKSIVIIIHKMAKSCKLLTKKAKEIRKLFLQLNKFMKKNSYLIVYILEVFTNLVQ